MERWNPIVIGIYFMSVTGIAMLCMNPVIQAIGLIGAVVFFCIGKAGRKRGHLPMLALALIAFLINPLFTHNGATVLFFLNGNPITLEAVVYGAVCGMMLLSMLYWFRSFSVLMSSDKILYLLGKVSSKLALMVSMVLRYIPLFSAQLKKTAQAQRAMGAIRSDDALARIRGGIRVFSVTLTWALENGIVTADGMEARGYGDGKRTSFAIYRFQRRDGVLTAVIAILSGLVLYGMFSGSADCRYYPTFAVEKELTSMLVYGAYTLLAVLPSVMEAGERVKWKYLKLKI